ncbi:MAG TPA: hypothetical protein VK176_01200, partial [Phycisphaerales bacterium]|nr:hypothetical protein [Phycisphaerales bacterium]
MTTNPSSPQDEPKIPTEDEIAALPRGARVAFAARCARRVQPLFTHFWPDAPRKHVEAIDNAITLAERRFEGSRSASVNVYADAARAAARADDAAADAAYADAPAAYAAA